MNYYDTITIAPRYPQCNVEPDICTSDNRSFALKTLCEFRPSILPGLTSCIEW
jgi:hypothetical protein